MFKRIAKILLLLFVVLPAAVGRAQGAVTSIQLLAIDLWPDYDQASVLVLLTGDLPADTVLPATVTLPLPENANFSVVARIDASDNQMKDDIDFVTAPGEVTFTTPDLRFRLEYYMPYLSEAGQRDFRFTWLADLDVNELRVTVQQPRAATSLLTEPGSSNLINGQDGLTYHSLPVQAVPAGQQYLATVNYTMSSDQLSAPRSAPSITEVQTTGLSPASSATAAVDWPLIAAIGGGMLIVIAVTWQIASARATSRPRKPRPVRTEERSRSASQYCHICGQPLQVQDKFCRECGTAVKGR